MDSRAREISLRLDLELDDVRIIGICGIGGIGKTTIAKVIYNQFFYQFEHTSFLENISEISKNQGLLHLQNQLLCNILEVEENIYISAIGQGSNMIKNILRSKRVFIVLDDVDDSNQLESLVGNHDWLGNGSRVIITTRNKHLLTVQRVDELYEVEKLKFEDGYELFNWHAFRQNIPKQDFINLSYDAVCYCQGLPLALKILGSLLIDKTRPQWKSELKKLKREPDKKIHNILKRSFHGLDHTQKDIFLDIACCFKGKKRNFVSRILDGCNFYVERGLKDLSDKCLITILNNWINMHDLIQQMGWEIIRGKFPNEPSKWSRLWDPEDIERAFATSEAMKKMEAVFLDLSRLKQMQFNTKVLSKMNKLRLLKVYWRRHYGHVRKDYKLTLPENFKLILPENFEFPSYELRYLYWERYSLKSLPSNFKGENLVKIKLPNSNIRQLWQGNKCLGKLKVLDLSDSKQLIELPNFSNISNLEKLILHNCRSLDKIDSSIEVLKNLNVLDLSWCKKLTSLPSGMQYLDSLEILNLNGCSNLEKFPKIRWSFRKGLKEIRLDGTPIKELPFSIDDLTLVKILSMGDCKNVRSLLSSIGSLKSLQLLYLQGCSNLETFPEITEDMASLELLSLSETAIKELPPTIQHLKQLRLLFVGGCSRLEKFPKILESLKDSLINLDLSNRNLMDGAIPNEIWCLSLLEILNLRRNNFRHIPAAITQLRKLTLLKISHCKMLQGFPEVPLSLKHIEAHDCTSLETLSSPSSKLWSSLLQWFKSAKFQDHEAQPKCAGIMIPGSSGIPGWVLHQEMEREVRIELPMNWCKDNHFLGFVLFCLYQDNGTDPYLSYDLRLHDDEDSYEAVRRGWFGCQCDYYPNIYSGVLDELWVTYHPKISIPEKYHSNQFKHIQTSFSALTVGVIKSCGIHLIYSQDHQQKNTALLDSLGTQDDDLPDNFQDNTESVAEDTNGNVKRRRINPSRGATP